MFSFRHKNNPYFQWGITAFLTVFALFSVYDIFFGAHKIISFFRFLTNAAMPVIYGCVIAYLLAPIVNFIERTLFRVSASAAQRKPQTWVRVTSTLLTLFLVLGSITLLLRFMIPDVANSLTQLVDNIPRYVSVIQSWFRQIEINSVNNDILTPEMVDNLSDLYSQAASALYEITTVGIPGMLATVTGGVFGIVGFFGNLIVGLVVAAYMLGMKETLSAQGKKIICAVFEREYAEHVLASFRYTDEVFGGFVRGNLLDALIVGIISFIILNFLGIPYAPLLSVLIGVTNLIPFFGPFVGAIPSCILIFLVNPIMCLEFIIFILILQQCDGNIIKPKIFGQSMGIASLWVIISIIIGGALFGTIGMLLGCPVFALFYTALRLIVEWKLKKRNMPTATDLYRKDGIPPQENGGQEKL